MKTSELTGAALDWAVAKAEGWNDEADANRPKDRWLWKGNLTAWLLESRYSTDWSQGGPIIEREKISSEHKFFPEGWECRNGRNAFARGPTALIAAMRCFVSSRLGEEVEVPDELA